MTGEKPLLVVGSFNPAKAGEMADLLSDLNVPVKSARGFPGVKPVPEDGTTFAENARIKAVQIEAQLGQTEDILGVVADDSGLEVDALDKRPGVYSARYLGEKATDPERVRGILGELGDLPEEKRTARFRCAIAFARRGKVPIATEGVVEGRIAFAPAGDFGFGYDPIFIPEGHERTFAELGAEVKHRISHRAVALREFHERLVAFLGERKE